jgi:hypothetical protein
MLSCFFWPCAARLIKSELLVPYVELRNDDSGWTLCEGLPPHVLFGQSV